jgi:hypothetical protein
VRQKAEAALNLLAGAQSADYKDWNGDGQTESRGSYGLVVNGSNFGYIEAVNRETEFTINTAGATEYMTAHGEVVKSCAQNISLLASDLRGLLLVILDPTTADPGLAESIHASGALIDQILNGMDLDNNGEVDAVSGECGTETLYAQAYHMADMPILPVSISYQLTTVANSTLFPSTPGNDGENDSVAATPKPNPTKKPNPTAKPKPTRKPPKTQEPKK